MILIFLLLFFRCQLLAAKEQQQEYQYHLLSLHHLIYEWNASKFLYNSEYFSDVANQRSFVTDLCKSLHISLSQLTSMMICHYGGSEVLTRYASLNDLLRNLFPEYLLNSHILLEKSSHSIAILGRRGKSTCVFGYSRGQVKVASRDCSFPAFHWWLFSFIRVRWICEQNVSTCISRIQRSVQRSSEEDDEKFERGQSGRSCERAHIVSRTFLECSAMDTLVAILSLPIIGRERIATRISIDRLTL